MNSLNIDFRGESLRVLTARDGVLKHVLISRQFSMADPKSAKAQLLDAVKEAGGKKGKANIILPHSILKLGTFQVPAMDISDAEKVVRREIAKELGHQNFVLGARRIVRNLQGKQDILAEYATKSDILPYLTLLKACGIRPSVITTSLEGIISAFNKVRPETEGNEAVLEIGQSFIEIIVFNDGRLVNYKKVQMPAIDESKLSSKDMDHAQICKIKMYTIVDALYNFIIESGTGTGEEKLSRLWISGLGSIEEGTTQCVSEGLGVNSSLLNPFDVEVEQASIYASVAGLSRLTPADQIVNLVPSDERDKGRQLAGRSVIIAALVFYVILISGGYAVLSRSERDLKAIKERSDADIKAAQKSGAQDRGQQDILRKVLANNKDLYSLFRDIANMIPPDINLTRLDIEKTGGATFMELGASLGAGNESLRNSSVSKFLKALESTGRLVQTGAPEISTVTAAAGPKKQEITVKARFEVLQ